MMNPLRRVGTPLSETTVGRLFGRPVTVGWIVLVSWVIFVCVGLIAWSVRHNYQADRESDERATARAEYFDCLSTNARRADVEEIALKFVENDRFFIEFVDSFIPGGLDDAFKQPLLDRYAQQVDDIEAAYKPEPCPLPPATNPEE